MVTVAQEKSNQSSKERSPWFDDDCRYPPGGRQECFTRRIDSATGSSELVFRMDLTTSYAYRYFIQASGLEELRSLLSDLDVQMSTTYGNAASKPGH